MQEPLKTKPTEKKHEQPGTVGPTAPAPSDDETRDKEPKVKAPDNRKGGYGAG